jgi:hypothetical protein
MYMCHEFGIDLLEEVEKKLILNGQKYPIEKSRGSSKKYSDFDEERKLVLYWI